MISVLRFPALDSRTLSRSSFSIGESTRANLLKPRGGFIALGSQRLVDILLVFVMAAPVMKYRS